MNVLNAIGNVGKDCEIRYTPAGKAVASFSFALTSGYGDKQVTSWINCNLWGDRAETLSPMLVKGTKVGITGELTNRPYTDKQGVEKYSLECRINDLTLLTPKPKSDSQPSSNTSAPAKQNNAPTGSGFDDFNDDVPF